MCTVMKQAKANESNDKGQHSETMEMIGDLPKPVAKWPGVASSDTFLRLLDELEAVKIAEEEASKSEALKVLCGWFFLGHK